MFGIHGNKPDDVINIMTIQLTTGDLHVLILHEKTNKNRH